MSGKARALAKQASAKLQKIQSKDGPPASAETILWIEMASERFDSWNY